MPWGSNEITLMNNIFLSTNGYMKSLIGRESMDKNF